jgi:hypothetical protein
MLPTEVGALLQAKVGRFSSPLTGMLFTGNGTTVHQLAIADTVIARAGVR